MKHTPGPWRFDEEEMKIKGTDDVNFHTVIANVSPKMDYSRGMATQIANARLIAAAPEIKSKLEDMIMQDVSIRILVGATYGETTIDAISRMQKKYQEATGAFTDAIIKIQQENKELKAIAIADIDAMAKMQEQNKELLEALEDLLKLHSQSFEDGSAEYGFVSRAKAAIAKAKGGKP